MTSGRMRTRCCLAYTGAITTNLNEREAAEKVLRRTSARVRGALVCPHSKWRKHHIESNGCVFNGCDYDKNAPYYEAHCPMYGDWASNLRDEHEQLRDKWATNLAEWAKARDKLNEKTERNSSSGRGRSKK